MPGARSTLGFHSPFCTNLVELGFMSPMPQSIPNYYIMKKRSGISMDPDKSLKALDSPT